MQTTRRKLLIIFESPTVFILECSTPEVISALGINPELELTILLKGDWVLYADKAKEITSDAGKITAGKAWKALASIFKGDIFAVKEDAMDRGIVKSCVAPQIQLIQRSHVAPLMDRSDTIMIY